MALPDNQIANKKNPLGTRKASVAIFLLAMSVLMVEVTLTRVFSVMSWHHFAYLIISLAFLGFGAAGSYMTVSNRFAGSGFDGQLLSKCALAYSIALVIGFAASTKVRFYAMDIYFYGDYSNAFSLLMLCVLVGIPFFFAGICIGYMISHAGDAINRVYFSDLLGAGTGTLLSIVGINFLGAEGTIYAAAASAGLVALMFSMDGEQAKRWSLRVGSLAVLCICVFMAVFASRHEIFPVYFPPQKIFRSAMEPHYFRWHVVARIDVFPPENKIFVGGGALSPRFDGKVTPVQVIYQDGHAPTGIVNVPGGDLSKVPILGYILHGAPYIIKPKAEQALVIGVGGGIDVLIALAYGAQHVTGVEVNPVTVDAIMNKYADFAGEIFSRPDVEIVVAEGRHYLTTTDERFDVIQLSGVDTYSALSLGAYAMAENYLYTVEAMHGFWDRLRDDGILSFSRFLFDPPRESLRLVTTQMEALDNMGIESPEKHIMILSGPAPFVPWADVMLKKSPFTQQEAATYRQWAKSLGFSILYDPYQKRSNAFDMMIRATPAERAVMIEQHPFNVSPSNDDNPFFFQYYRWRSLVRPVESRGGVPINQLPLGLLVMLLSLIQVLLLATISIVVPLIPQSGRLRHVKHKGRLLLYFGALGWGFITVEIALLQKFAVFVGGPIYSMAITLFAILVFSGLGSLAAKRFTRSIDRGLPLIMIALIAAIVGETLFVNYAIPRLMFLSHEMRCVVAVLALAPLALVMGMPFPTGMRLTQRIGDAVVPWAWGVNAAASTLGSVICILASMELGFTITLISGAVIYVIGFAALGPVARSIAEGEDEALTQ
jgi:spermidine synthase